MAKLLRSLADRIDLAGEDFWERLHDWEKAASLGINLVRDEPGEDDDEDGNPRPRTTSILTEQDRLEDVRAARWFAEHVSLLTSLEAPVRRVHRLYDLAEVEDRKRRNPDGTFDPLLAAEAAIAGYCASCWRLDQQLVEIESDKHGHRYYKTWCRACGSFRAEHGILPPMELLRLRQRRDWNTSDVTAALVKANVRIRAS
jgi:hypothetical protein